jgi:hypothetical protein
MFYPSGLGKDLSELLGGYTNHLPLMVENHRPGTRGSLIKGHDIFFFHNPDFPLTPPSPQ